MVRNSKTTNFLLHGHRKNHQRALDSMQASLEAEARGKAESLRLKKKLEADINELEVGHSGCTFSFYWFFCTHVNICTNQAWIVTCRTFARWLLTARTEAVRTRRRTRSATRGRSASCRWRWRTSSTRGTRPRSSSRCVHQRGCEALRLSGRLQNSKE